MKISRSTFFAILFFAVLPVFSQDTNKWLRIETDDKEFSVAVPRTNIIDAEKRDFGKRLTVVAYENGVEMVVGIVKSKDAKERVSRINTNDTTKSEVFKVGDFLIRKFDPSFPEPRTFFNTIVIAKNDNFYSLVVRSKTGNEPEFARFMYSIRLGGKPLIVNKETTSFPEETVVVSQLKTSPEVVEAFNRKTGKNKGKVTYERVVNYADADDENKNLTHRAIVLHRPFPSFTPSSNPTRFAGVFEMKLKVQFLANGEIGDIVVLSEIDKNFTEAVIDSTRKIVFIPARRGNEFVDSIQTVSYSMRFDSPSPIIRR